MAAPAGSVDEEVSKLEHDHNHGSRLHRSDEEDPASKADSGTASRSGHDESIDRGDSGDRIEVTLEGAEHPFNWPLLKRWLVTLQASLLIFSATITSSAPSGGTANFRSEYGFSELECELLVSIFLVGYSVGPFITAPSTETFGRRWPSIVFMALYTVFNGACAACTRIAPLLVCRFLAGTFASAPITNSGSMTSDVWRPAERGMVMSIWSLGSFAGPALGPIVGGFLSASGLPVYWIFVVITALTAAMTGVIALFLPETYVPQLLHIKAKRMREETGDARFCSKHSEDRKSVLVSLRILLTRPFLMFVREPILVLSTIYSSFSYTIIYMLFPLYPIIFHEIHGLPAGVGDLPFLATLGGVACAIPITYLYQQKYRRDLASQGGKHVPELRLPMANAGGLSMLIALLWLGWTGHTTALSPALPSVSGVFTGIASALVFRSFSQYVIECYKDHSASAMAALVVVRSLMGAGLPLAVQPMVRAMGVQWVATLLAGVQIVLIPVPFLFSRYGRASRQRSAYSQGQ